MNKSSLTSSKPWYKRPLWIVTIVFAAILIGANGWLFYKDSHPQSYINFTQYEPTKIVDGLKVESKTLNIWNSNLFSPITVFIPYSVDISLGLNRQDSYIVEGKYETIPFDSTCDGVNIDCSDKTTSQGQIYKLISVYDSGMIDRAKDKLTSQEVLFNKNEAQIRINMKNNDSNPIIEKDWSDMIDSFRPTTFNDLQVRHMQPGP